jgi:hypothetical protein
VQNYHQLFADIFLNEVLKKSYTSQKLTKSKNVHDSFLNSSRQLTYEAILEWLNKSCAKLKELNKEHAKILMELKKFVQFPDLYAELYNL